MWACYEERRKGQKAMRREVKGSDKGCFGAPSESPWEHSPDEAQVFANNIARFSIATSVYIRTTCLRLPRYNATKGRDDGVLKDGNGRKLPYLRGSGRRQTEARKEEEGKEIALGRFKAKRKGRKRRGQIGSWRGKVLEQRGDVGGKSGDSRQLRGLRGLGKL